MNSSDDTLIVQGNEIAEVAHALRTGSRIRIIRLLQKSGPLMITNIASKLNMTEANASAQVKILEKVGIITADYEPGEHGLRKLCRVAKNKLVIDLSE